MGFGIRQASSFCIGYVTLGGLFHFSEFQPFICEMGITILPWWLSGKESTCNEGLMG